MALISFSFLILFPSPLPSAFFSFFLAACVACFRASLFLPCPNRYVLVCASGDFFYFVSFRFAQKKRNMVGGGVEARGGGASIFERKKEEDFCFFVLGL